MTSQEIKQLLHDAGTYTAGVAEACPVDDDAMERYAGWLGSGAHGEMHYLENHAELRRDPAKLLEGARSVISCAFNYYYPITRSAGEPRWAMYALGTDYHEVVRRRLESVATCITQLTGAACRVCVDSAPILEHYWAVKAGIGFMGLNRQLIIPDAGTHFFLGEILTTLPLEADTPSTGSCLGCRRCITACPGKALSAGSPLDATRCLSYLTIEHRGDFPEGHTPLGTHVYGCDTCQSVCPHNSHPPISNIPEFAPRPEILALTREEILRMTQPDFSRIFTHSAIKRTKLAGLIRNALHLGKHT